MFSILYIKKIAGKIYFKKRTLIFAEVEENEEDREKLKQWLKKVDKRNFTKPPLRKTAFEKIKPCEKMFADLAGIGHERNHPKICK